jgi:aspartyl-tRNA(Asn)/glutamyl-tRNA(Gln) amidotransferase subunit A
MSRDAASPDPFAEVSLAEYARRLRQRKVSIERTVAIYLARIEQLDPKLGAYEHVSATQALDGARALDDLLAAGVDLGPLMGVPVAVKDLFAVDGMPTTAGSNLDVAELIGSEGTFVKGLRRAGCIILGKTKTVEFAFGAVGTNSVRGTPWNPSDAQVHRIPSGSSSGSAVAVAAGLCAFAIGTDTGGSVRLPAALCGVFGLKTTFGLWPLDGVFPLSPSLDSIGLLTRTAEDAALAFATLTGRSLVAPFAARGLRLGKPKGYFFRNLEPAVERCVAAAEEALTRAGAVIVDIDVPEAAERESFFPVVMPAELLAVLGRERFEAGRERIDPVVANRVARVLDMPVERYIRALRRQRELIGIAKRRMHGLDGWITPTATLLPPPVAEVASFDSNLALAFAITQNAQPVNLFERCAISLPIHQLGAPLPVGLQLVGAPFCEDNILSVGLAVERLVGVPAKPDLSAFAQAGAG